jgi:hypothetical protein
MQDLLRLRYLHPEKPGRILIAEFTRDSVGSAEALGIQCQIFNKRRKAQYTALPNEIERLEMKSWS